jgi:hypothetical protein
MDCHTFSRIQPGDIGFDAGIGFSGLIIRLGTRSSYGHCWVYHELEGIRPDGVEVWSTVEAGPRNGVVKRFRTVPPIKVVRVWKDKFEQADLLKKSAELVGCSYGWGEIARIVFRIVGVKIGRWWDNPTAVICSNHVTQAAVAARPDLGLYLRFTSDEIWPGELAVTFDAYIWDRELA